MVRSVGFRSGSKHLPNSIARFNPYHDERGHFTTADGVGSGAGRPANSSTASDGKSSAKPLNGTDDSVPRAQGTEYRPSKDAPASVAPAADRSSYPGVIVVLPDGSKIPDANSPTGYMMAPIADLSAVAAAGRKAGEEFRELAADSEGSASAWTYLGLELGLSLGRAGLFDYQRAGNFLTGYTNFPLWANVSNFNVGLFGQQTGLSLNQTTGIAGTFSTVTFAANRNQEQSYSPNSDQYKYLLMGYQAGESGMFEVPVKSH